MDNSASIKFLQKWNPAGPWVLTAIQIDRKGIETRTFDPKSLQQLEAWLTLHNGMNNIYFHVNSTIGVLDKKANREDIKSVDWLHVDIDPIAGQDIQQERDRCLDLLTNRLPKGIPAPSVIVFSGGGFQGFWKLEKPIEINGDLGLAEDAKRYNQQLEVLFGADNCHNIDRIMRLPGTWNIPDAKKLKKGRTKELARVIDFNDNVYPISNFTAAAGVQIKGDIGFSGSKPEIHISGNIRRIADLDELDEWDVPDRVKVIIAQGRHPEQPKNGDNSRSSWVFDCVCNLVRCNVPDEIIFSILTDKDWGISESILEVKSSAEKYAIRQIERAKEWAIDPQLVKLNERFAVIGNMGGKCRIIEEVMDAGLDRTRLTKQSFDDFANRFRNIQIKVGEDAAGNEKTVSLGKWWINHFKRRQFDYIVFVPGKDTPNSYNLWKGFAVEAKPGNHEAFLEHVLKNVCNGDEVIYNYVVGWMARAVQQPASTGEVAIVMRGKRGVGKSFFAKQFGALFGRHFLQVSNSSHLVGNFNAHLRDTVVLFADEAFYAQDRKHASVLKTLITEDTIPIEAKGVDVETAPNYVHLIMASNDTHVVPAGADERRFLVLDVGTGNQQDIKYFQNLANIMDNGGRAALLHYLMSYDISKFEVRKVPNTDALQEQKLLSLSVEEEWWYQRLQEGRVVSSHSKWETCVLKDELQGDYIENARKFNINRRGSATSLGKFLARMVPNLSQKQLMAEISGVTGDGFSFTKKERRYHYIIPTLSECRKKWESAFGPEKWPSYEEHEEITNKTVPF